METLAADPIWDVFENTSTLEEFKSKVIPKVFIHPNASKNILKPVQVIKKLLVQSFFEYSFTDVAMQYSIFTLEKAMRERYEETTNTSSKRHSFKFLIDYFFDNGYFEVFNKEVLTQLRNIRNGNVHEVEHSQAGIIAFNKVSTTIDLINDLYLNPKYRKERQDYLIQLSKRLDQSQNDGYILRKGDEKFIIFKVLPIFLDNIQDLNLLHLICVPIFKLLESNTRMPALFNMFLTNFSLDNNNTLIGTDEYLNEIILNPMNVEPKEENKIKYKIWKTDFEKLKENKTLLFSLNSSFNTAFTHSRRELLLKECTLI